MDFVSNPMIFLWVSVFSYWVVKWIHGNSMGYHDVWLLRQIKNLSGV